MTPTPVSINPVRLAEDLKTLSDFTAKSSGGGVTRRAWTDEYFAAQKWLGKRMEEAGLAVHVDGAGNLWGVWDDGGLPAVVAGSHIDTVPSGGMFDGALGVIGGLEAVRSLREAGHRPSRQIRVVAWMEEEGSRFGVGLFGSKAMVGALGPGDLQGRTSADGARIEDALEAIGSGWEVLAQLPQNLQDLGTYVELHIEQGPVLHREGVAIGVVTHIVGMECLSVNFKGAANHAGTTPMGSRRDAAVGAARAVLEVRDLAIRHRVRGTVGAVEVQPGASNVIPGRARLTVDARHHDAARLRGYMRDLRRACDRIAVDEDLRVNFRSEYRVQPAALDRDIVGRIRRAAEDEGLSHMEIVSGGGHDAMVVAPHVPTGMIFVPSRGGISHAPEEFTEPAHCAAGAQVLARVLGDVSAGDTVSS